MEFNELGDNYGQPAHPGHAGKAHRHIQLPIIAVRIRLELAKVCSQRGNVAAGRHLVREIDDILLYRPTSAPCGSPYSGRA